jgi:hypothetical protein
MDRNIAAATRGRKFEDPAGDARSSAVRRDDLARTATTT